MRDNPQPDPIDFHSPVLRRHRRVRGLVDRLVRGLVRCGGLGLLALILLIMGYLLQVVAPLFQSARLDAAHALQSPWLDARPPLLLAQEGELGLRIDQDGLATFFDSRQGTPAQRQALAIPAGERITRVAEAPPGQTLLAAGLSNDAVLLADYGHLDQGTLTYPQGMAPIRIGQGSIEALAVAGDRQGITLATLQGGHLQAMSNDSGEQHSLGNWPWTEAPPLALFIDRQGQWLHAVTPDAVWVYDLRSGLAHGRYALPAESTPITAAGQLLGGVSLLLGDRHGQISQWFMTQEKDQPARLRRIRGFTLADAPIRLLRGDARRKGFLAVDTAGNLGLYQTTAERQLLRQDGLGAPRALALGRDNHAVLLERDGQLLRANLHNPYPDVSWRALWGEVWYEHHDSPQQIWQSSAAGDDYEPKLSLAPLTFGTLKAAFYAMLLAAPLAIAAAIYTAQLMAPPLRRKVKPTLELMESLPTVIIGFFAGLFLAPFVETHLPGLIAIALVAPLMVMLCAALLGRWSASRGWEAVLLLAPLLLTSALLLYASPWLETALMEGDARQWLNRTLGIDYAQHNALVVGMAMGFAVIPSIFSIAEDALYAVPRGLTLGSLALGASAWQTLVRVVVPTASPGIFSALMIGLGRAVGETMIVLMATGNTPIMDASLFQGLRSLAANLAIELPEAEAASSHYRVLVLSALLLLLFTFVMNTLAEVIRQRLRSRYATL